MIRKITRIVFATSLCCTMAWQTASAHKNHRVDLLQVYYQACTHDPIYQEAEATWLASREALPQSVAAVLPSVSMTASSTGTKRREARSSTFRFNTQTYALTLTQPLVNFASWARIKEANETVKQAAANFLAAQQNLMVRTATAYFDVLFAKDSLRFTQAELRATARQLEQARQRYKVGLVAVTAVYEARAVYDQIRADMIASENNLENSREKLRELTGMYYPHLAPVKRRVPLLKPQPTRKQAWVRAALAHNPSYAAARFAAEAAHTEIGALYAGHLPSLNLVGTLDKTAQGQSSAVLPANNMSNRSLGLQLTIPILAGGAVLSQTHQQQHVFEAALAAREQSFRATMVGTRQTYNSIIAGISKIQADRRSIASQRSSLESTEAAYKVGTRTIVDVLQVQRDLFRAQETHALDQYNFINNTLLLKEFAGTLCVRDIEAINRWLQK